MKNTPTGYPPEAVAPPAWATWEHVSPVTGRRMTARSPLHDFHVDFAEARLSYRSDPTWTNGYALGLLHGHGIGHRIGRTAALKEKTP